VAETIDPEFDYEARAYVLLEMLVPQEFGRRENLVDLGGVRLHRLRSEL
jgi:hypothetical protein